MYAGFVYPEAALFVPTDMFNLYKFDIPLVTACSMHAAVYV